MRTAPQCSLMMTLSSKLRISTRTRIKARFFFAPSTTTRTCWNRDESTLSTLKMFSFTYLAGNEIMLLERASASMSRMSLRKCVLHKQLNDNCSIHTLHTHTHTRTNLIQGSGVCAVAEITKPFAVIVWIAMQGWSIYFPFFGGVLFPLCGNEFIDTVSHIPGRWADWATRSRKTRSLPRRRAQPLETTRIRISNHRETTALRKQEALSRLSCPAAAVVLKPENLHCLIFLFYHASCNMCR